VLSAIVRSFRTRPYIGTWIADAHVGMDAALHRVALVVAEREGDWQAWVDELRRSTPDVAVMVQRQGEAATAFAMRVRAKVTELDAEGGLVDAVAFVGGERFDDQILGSRLLAIRALVSGMVHAGGGRLVLDSGPRSGRARFAMVALAAAVADQVRGTGVSVAHCGKARALEMVA